MQKGCCVILWLRPVRSSCVPLALFEFPHFFLSLFLQYLPRGSTDTLVLQAELTRVREAEITVAPASAHEDVEGLVWKVALLKGELVEACQA
jgi:hypothetical protein